MASLSMTNSEHVVSILDKPNGGQLLAWDHGDHHYEIETLTDGQPEFFYRNRATGINWESSPQESSP